MKIKSPPMSYISRFQRAVLGLLFIISFFSIGCTTSKEMVYLNDLKSDSTAASFEKSAKYSFSNPIQKNDLLWIVVGGPNSQDLTALNSAIGFPGGQGAGGAVTNQAANILGYLVESDGTIKLPYVGKVIAEGLTRVELEEKLRVLFSDYTKDPIVNVRFMNYKVTVMGEVTRPGTFLLPNERITILEAIGMAGDLTVMGKRSEVLILREKNGVREIGRVNLLSRDILTSPYFYLETNDVVYVEPAPAKFFARERLPQFLTLAAGTLSLVLTALTISRL